MCFWAKNTFAFFNIWAVMVVGYCSILSKNSLHTHVVNANYISRKARWYECVTCVQIFWNWLNWVTKTYNGVLCYQTHTSKQVSSFCISFPYRIMQLLTISPGGTARPIWLNLVHLITLGASETYYKIWLKSSCYGRSPRVRKRAFVLTRVWLYSIVPLTHEVLRCLW
jgi:hypothetical protein